MTTEEITAPTVDQLYDILRETSAAIWQRAHEAVAAIPLALPGDAKAEEAAAVANLVAEEAHRAAEAFYAMRKKLSPVIVRLAEIEISANEAKATFHQHVLAEVVNINSAIATIEAVAGKQVH